jgi:hypothetical protein
LNLPVAKLPPAWLSASNGARNPSATERQCLQRGETKILNENNKKKWAAFTYFGNEVRDISKLFSKYYFPNYFPLRQLSEPETH